MFSIGSFIVFGVLALMILRAPYLGVVITISSLPIVAILPPIPFATSIVSLLGGVTLISYIMQQLRRRQALFLPHTKGLFWAVLFIIWMTVSNPSAALSSSSEGRNWFFTYIQLWMLAWLASQVLDTLEKHKVLMWVYSISAGISAFHAVQSGGIGATLRLSDRTDGLAGGENSAARYFIVAFVFLYYIWSETQNWFLKMILLFGMGITVLGTFNTISRTGMILLIFALGMLVVQFRKGKKQKQALIILAFVLGLTWIFADNIFSLLRTILPSIQASSDTIGLRYKLWKAGFNMWMDHVVQGVGIGQYTYQLNFYGQRVLISGRYLTLGAHNMYVQILAETGGVGLAFFLLMLGTSLRSFWNSAKNQENQDLAGLTYAWLVVFMVMLLGGITKHDQYDKMLWLSFGVGVSRFWLSRKMSENTKHAL